MTDTDTAPPPDLYASGVPTDGLLRRLQTNERQQELRAAWAAHGLGALAPMLDVDTYARAEALGASYEVQGDGFDEQMSSAIEALAERVAVLPPAARQRCQHRLLVEAGVGELKGHAFGDRQEFLGAPGVLRLGDALGVMTAGRYTQAQTIVAEVEAQASAEQPCFDLPPVTHAVIAPDPLHPPQGDMKAVMAWVENPDGVGTVAERATMALTVERAKGDKARKSLVKKLEALAPAEIAGGGERAAQPPAEVAAVAATAGRDGDAPPSVTDQPSAEADAAPEAPASVDEGVGEPIAPAAPAPSVAEAAGWPADKVERHADRLEQAFRDAGEALVSLADAIAKAAA